MTDEVTDPLNADEGTNADATGALGAVDANASEDPPTADGSDPLNADEGKSDSAIADSDVIQDFEAEEAAQDKSTSPGYERQTNRPNCPRCGKLMNAVSSPTRNSVAMTYYQCKEVECGERGIIPVPRKELVSQINRDLPRNAATIAQKSVAMRDHMNSTEGSS